VRVFWQSGSVKSRSVHHQQAEAVALDHHYAGLDVACRDLLAAHLLSRSHPRLGIAAPAIVNRRHTAVQKYSGPMLHGVDRHCATRPGAVLARLVSDYGDPLRSRYEHVDYESIVERLVGRHSPTQMGVSGLASRPEPWRPVMGTTCELINKTLTYCLIMISPSSRLGTPTGHVFTPRRAAATDHRPRSVSILTLGLMSGRDRPSATV
jgi:hypothetical protein